MTRPLNGPKQRAEAYVAKQPGVQDICHGSKVYRAFIRPQMEAAWLAGYASCARVRRASQQHDDTGVKIRAPSTQE